MHSLGLQRPAEAPGLDFTGNPGQPPGNRGEVAPREDPLRGEHAGMGERGLDVILGQPPVEGDRSRKALHPLVDRRGEARGPGRALSWHKNTVEDPFVTMVSIRQNTNRDVLPDFRNLGVIARMLIAVNAAVFGGALFAGPTVLQSLERFVQAAAFVEPLLLVIILVLYALSKAMRRLPYWAGCTAVVALVIALAAEGLRTEEHMSVIQSHSKLDYRL